MNEKQLKDIFNQAFKFDEWKPILEFVFGRPEYFSKPHNPFEETKRVANGKQLGRIKLDDGKSIALFEVVVDESINIERNRQGLREIAARHIDQNITHGAIVFYHSPKQIDYRFSFISKWSELDEESGALRKGETQKKRYTYLLGKNQSGATAAKRLLELSAKKNSISIKDVIQAFSVEALNREFFKKYREHYEKFWRYIDSVDDYQKILIDKSKDNEEDKRKPLRDFSKKLLGRIVFLHFLQKKAWLGCLVDTNKWENGDPQFMCNFFEGFKAKENFYSKGLVELFFNTLNNPNRPNNVFPLTGNRVPYLNGGLFDSDNPKTIKINFPSDYFRDLLDFFRQYNFTIDENSPDEQEVGIDPEMLGHIFENLLEENREKGAFYTPKEIVKYMCQESLIQYLLNHLSEEASIERFIREQHVSDFLSKKSNAEKLNKYLSDVKVCDPAIGSGAFPIGVLQEIYTAKLHIYPFLKSQSPFNPAETKKQIIQESIYGVDMEQGAVEIARLRFWLALVVDEDEPEPLPNLDYKIMQGDSLLERFEFIDLKKFGSSEDKEDDIILISEKNQIELGVEFSRKRQPVIVFDKVSKDQLEQLFNKYFDPEKWRKEKKEVVDKQKVKRQIEDIVEGKLHAKIIEEKFNLQNKIRTREKEWNVSGIKKDFVNKKSKSHLEYQIWQNKLTRIDEIEERLIQLQHTNEKPYFLWHLFFKEVFDKGGFDIVIGNPPYIQIQKLGKYVSSLVEANFETFNRTGDIYCLFYEKAFELLRHGGTLAFITSNKWMRSGYGQALRRFLAKRNSIYVVDLGPGVFQSATVDTNILIAKNSFSEKRLRGRIVTNKMALLSSEEELTALPNVGEDAWVILDTNEDAINETFRKVGRPLKSWSIKINFGIKTGYNPAFIVNEDKRNELISEDKNCEKIIRPVLKGREIERYIADETKDYLINTHNGVKDLKIERVNIDDYPSIKKHLHSKEHWNSVKNRQDQGDTPFNLRNCAYLKEFKSEKVIWKRIGSIMRFAYSDKEIYCLDSTCIATGEKIKYLTALLNSRVCLYQLIKTSPQTGTGDQIISVQALEPLKVYYPSDEEEHLVNNIVDYILFIKSYKKDLMENHNNQDLGKLFEDIIDLIAFELYFKEHAKEVDIDVIQHIKLPQIELLKIEEKKNLIQKLWFEFQEKNNPIRNKILVAESRSWIVKHINQVTSITLAS